MLTFLDAWFPPLLVLAFTFLAIATARWLIARQEGKPRWQILNQLRTPVSSLILIAGLKVFIEAAPLSQKSYSWIESGIYIVSAIIFFVFVRRAVLVAIEWSALKATPSVTLQQGFLPLMRNLVTLIVILMGSITVLKHFSYDVMSLITALGVGSLAVGLAAKDTLSNMISGFTLIIDRNLTPGDRIKLGDAAGEVEQIGLRSTRIRTGNGNTLIVPNSELVNTKILNLSQPTRAISCSTQLKFPIEYSFARIQMICQEEAGGLNQALKEKKPWVHLSQVNDGLQVVTIGFWLADLDAEGAALSEFHERALARLKRENLAPHPPQVTLLAGAARPSN